MHHVHGRITLCSVKNFLRRILLKEHIYPGGLVIDRRKDLQNRIRSDLHFFRVLGQQIVRILIRPATQRLIHFR